MLRNSEEGYGLVAIILHWTMAVLFFGLLTLGYIMVRVEDLGLQFQLYQWHKSFGFLALALAGLRLLWGIAGRRPREPESLGPLERKAALLAHILLYAALVAVPLTGWAVASATPLDIPSFAFNLFVIPHLPMAKSITAEEFWSRWHAVLGYTAGALAGGHALAALRHHFILKDEILVRMIWPGRKQ